MFSVYGTGGTVFRGSLEDLQRVSRTLGLTAPRKLDRVVDHLLAVPAKTELEAIR